MTPEEAKAHENALEALIGASLRAPDKETEVTDEEISRYVDQHVTLSSEDKAALEKAKPGVLQAIKDILHGNEQEDDDCTARPSKAGRVQPSASTGRGSAPDEFVEAVVIAQLTRLIATPEYPLGHLRQNKMVYFAHRKAEEDVSEHFLKQAAGPYSPWAKYQGPENIAQRNGYVKRIKVGNLVGFVVGSNIDRIDRYLSHYPVCAAVDWVVNKFRYRRKDELELLATVDFAALELLQLRRLVTMENIKHVIGTSKEWAPKLKRDIFSDEKIAQALAELRNLFPGTYA
jgi:type I restriction enzyme S subunit